MGQECSSNALPTGIFVWFLVRYHRALGSPALPPFLSPTRAAASPPGLFGQVGVEELQPGWEGWGGLTKQVQEAMSYPDCPRSLICGLAIVKSALLTCHLESYPTAILGGGCGSLLIKGEFPLWMGDKRQPQGVPLLNQKESDLFSLLGG